jgi:hypothetical protein
MDTSRRYPRTMEEAFGPYARGGITEQYAPMPLADKIIVALGIVVGTGVLAAIFLGVL